MAIRGPGIIGQRVAVIVDGKAYMWRGFHGGGRPYFNHRPRVKYEIVRDATPREVVLGHVF